MAMVATDAPLPQPSASNTNPADHSVFGPIHLTRAMIAIAAALCAIVFHVAAAVIHWPDQPGFHGSLGQPPVAMGALIIGILLLIICAGVGTLLVGGRWFMAGLMVATAGLTTWSVRGGNMSQVLFNANNSGANQAVFFQLIAELIVFYAVIAGLWNAIWTRHRRSEPPVKMSKDDTSRTTGGALVAQTAIMAALLLILAVSPMKKQVLTAVFLSGAISTAVAEYFFADRNAGRWYWLAPLVVGIFGYIAGYFVPAGIETGDLQSMFAPLARVLPLDYASVGSTGVLFGYWWMQPEVDATVPVTDAVSKPVEAPQITAIES